MSIHPLHPAHVLSGLALTAAACAPLPPPGPMGPPPSAAYNPGDFAWATQPGTGAIDGRVDFNLRGTRYTCTGPVAATPDTPYTRARFYTLYGSNNRAAIPEAVVRQRTVADANADYRGFVRSGTCTDGRFRIESLPDGGWFVISPVAAEGEDRIVLMRRVEVRGGRTVAVDM